MTSPTPAVGSRFDVRENRTGSPSFIERVRRVWEYRELLVSLTRRELKVKYKNSVLGFMWTLLNPLLYLAVFTVVFTVFLKSNVPLYGVFFLSGLLAWNLFATGVTGATTSITGNGPLVQKVWFPREILPLSAVAAALVNFFFQLIVLVVALVVFQRSPEWDMLWLLFPALLVTMIWTVALGVVLVGRQRLLPRHPALPRARAPGVVLDDPGRVPVRPHRRRAARAGRDPTGGRCSTR